ncbi:MAG: CusA/CzcA family heavy metal efflux RND transporter [Candidatus Omnitrophica bacterium CG11_big_fil_rev_8_21_14_0_20_64_10]|nr:MAG: CusA/CzcA family heavy metal efflux RND transporter [Candidatus Omnitrophica bacterium CG11_big_fil_rev_8_21_14_0_20_64_10]
MIERLIAWSVRNRLFIFILAAAAAYGGILSIQQVPLDAIPDLSDTQVIVFTEWPGQSPDLIEDQVTYPIVTSLLSAPKVQFVRGQSMFGMSFVYVIFEDGTDLYWARSRVLEYLQGISAGLPEGAVPTLGPDATGVGWVFQYALMDESGQNDLGELRALQDWNLRYALSSVEGVAEVASVGGYVRQYQIEIQPAALLARGIPLGRVVEAVRRSNADVGGRVVEWNGVEYAVRGRGYIQSTEDIEQIAVGASADGTPVLIKDLARVQIGPDSRRGLAELDGRGETVGGIVIARPGENTLKVIERVKQRLRELEPTLPEGVRVVVAYDRSDLIHRAIDTLREKLAEEMLVVSLVILLFLWHLPSALIPIVTLPLAILLSFIPMSAMGLTSNIMSLGGIAIAIGAMVDASIVLVENAHKRIERWQAEGKREPFQEILVESAQEVGRPIFFSLLVIAVAFIPIFALEGQEGRLFKPLAFTKNFAMTFAAILSVTLAPALMSVLIRVRRGPPPVGRLRRRIAGFLGGEIRPEEEHPISRSLFRIYEPVVRWVLDRRKRVIAASLGLVLATVPVFLRLGSEFMPPLWEGAFLYMPTTLPGLSVTEAGRILNLQNRILAEFPEVERVFGKAGRAETPTDPAPLSMIETVVTLKPHTAWRPGMTVEKLKAEMDQALQIPGMPNIWWMPIQTRTEMLTTGIRSVLGVKVLGADLQAVEETAKRIEQALGALPDTQSAFAERSGGGYFIDFEVDRAAAGRYGLTVSDVNEVVQTAIGGMNITQTVEGRERYPISVRYPRELRNDPETLRQALVPTPSGAQVPIGQLARLEVRQGPAMIRDEDGVLASFVFVDVKGGDLGRYVERAKEAVAREVVLPAGTRLEWAGQYRYLQRAQARLAVVLPLTLLIIGMLLYFNTRSWVKVGIVLLAVPFSLIGAIWLLWFLGYNMSVAVWVGLIALAGLDAETGTVMLLYLDLAYDRAKKQGLMRTFADLKEAIVHGAVKRIRPKLMTVSTTFIGLLPIMWAGAHAAGADVMKRIAAPMVGGIFTSFLLELLVYPAVYAVWKWRFEMKQGQADWIRNAGAGAPGAG